MKIVCEVRSQMSYDSSFEMFWTIGIDKRSIKNILFKLEK